MCRCCYQLLNVKAVATAAAERISFSTKKEKEDFIESRMLEIINKAGGLAK